MPIVPNTIGKYEVLGVLGEGAMGVVYEGYDPHIERRVAIKTLHKHLVYDPSNSDDEYLIRFQREAKAAAKCIHPNIVLILEYGEDSGTPYIVMEFVEGNSLADIFKSNKKLSLQTIFSLFSQILKGLNTAHQQGVVHRDIKPANIMVMNNNTVKLADFGIARIGSNAELTQVGVAVGTPRYMAPEQLFGHKVDHRADVFSATLILLDLLAIRQATQNISLAKIPTIKDLPPNNKIKYENEIPEILIPIIKKGLAPIADKRFASVIDLAKALKSILPQLSQANSISDKNSNVDAKTIIQPRNDAPINLNATSMDTTYEETAISAQTNIQTKVFELDSNIEDFAGQSTLVNGMDTDTFNQLKTDLSKYIGDEAEEKIMQETANAISMAEIINSLAENIPKKKHRQQFIDRWIQ